MAEHSQKKHRNKCTAMFDFANVRKSFHTAFKPRPQSGRPLILMLIIAFVLEIFLIQGRGPFMYLYLRLKFSWTEQTFGQYVAIFGVVGIFTQYVAVPFLTERGWSDTAIGYWGVMGAIVQCVIGAFAQVEWLLYMAGVVALLRLASQRFLKMSLNKIVLFSSAITTTCRSMVTKSVSPFEVGSVFAVMASFQVRQTMSNTGIWTAFRKICMINYFL
jgi:hypothetical protein